MNKLTQDKLEMWNKKLLALEKLLVSTMKQKGEAAAEGDLSENAAYKMAAEEAETLRVRISEIKNILAELENPSA